MVLEIEPAAVVTTEACDADEDEEFALRIWSETETLLHSEDTGTITIERDLRDYEGQPAELRLTACDDTTDYRDSIVTLTLHAESLKTPAGATSSPDRLQLSASSTTIPCRWWSLRPAR